jgi:hypothetical protein
VLEETAPVFFEGGVGVGGEDGCRLVEMGEEVPTARSK